jgi:hypothetical protein
MATGCLIQEQVIVTCLSIVFNFEDFAKRVTALSSVHQTENFH